MSAARPSAAQQPPPETDNAETPLSRLKAALGYAFKRPKEGEEVCMFGTTATVHHMAGLSACVMLFADTSSTS